MRTASPSSVMFMVPAVLCAALVSRCTKNESPADAPEATPPKAQAAALAAEPDTARVPALLD